MCIDQCPEGFFIYSGYPNKECLSTCGAFFLNTKTNECVSKCPLSLIIDSKNNKCVEECPDDLFLFLFFSWKECVESCGLFGQYGHRKTKKWSKTCPDDSYYHLDQNECVESCGAFYEDFNSKTCASRCLPSQYTILLKKQCVNSCADVSLYPNDLRKTCDFSCPKGLIGNSNTFRCQTFEEYLQNSNTDLDDSINDLTQDTPILKNENQTIQFVNTSNKGEDNSNTSKIDLGECRLR